MAPAASRFPRDGSPTRCDWFKRHARFRAVNTRCPRTAPRHPRPGGVPDTRNTTNMDGAGWEHSWWDSCRRGPSNVHSEDNRVASLRGGVSAGPHLFRAGQRHCPTTLETPREDLWNSLAGSLTECPGHDTTGHASQQFYTARRVKPRLQPSDINVTSTMPPLTSFTFRWHGLRSVGREGCSMERDWPHRP